LSWDDPTISSGFFATQHQVLHGSPPAVGYLSRSLAAAEADLSCTVFESSVFVVEFGGSNILMIYPMYYPKNLFIFI
jgi:hypothetical protein